MVENRGACREIHQGYLAQGNIAQKRGAVDAGAFFEEHGQFRDEELENSNLRMALAGVNWETKSKRETHTLLVG